MTRKDRTFEVVYKNRRRKPKLDLAQLLMLAENGKPPRPVEISSGSLRGFRSAAA